LEPNDQQTKEASERNIHRLPKHTLDTAERLRTKTGSALKNEDPLIAAEGYDVRQRSTVLREDQTRIPKQVRDDNEREFLKLPPG